MPKGACEDGTKSGLLGGGGGGYSLLARNDKRSTRAHRKMEKSIQNAGAGEGQKVGKNVEEKFFLNIFLFFCFLQPKVRERRSERTKF